MAACALSVPLTALGFIAHQGQFELARKVGRIGTLGLGEFSRGVSDCT